MKNRAKWDMIKRDVYARFPYLIEITLASGTVYRYCNCDDDIDFTETDSDGNEVTNTFTGAVFSITPPDIKESTIGNGTLNISAVDQTWIEVIRTETERAKIRFVGAIEYDDEDNVETVEAIDDTTYTLTEANWTDTSISWTMVFDENMAITIPCDTATSKKVPALI